MDKNTGRALGTAAVWGGVALVTYQFHSFGMLNVQGAAWMILCAFALTASIWHR